MTEPTRTLVILGAGGDLTKRLLLPGLGQLLDSGQAGELDLVGVGQTGIDEADWRQRVAESFEAGGATGPTSKAVAENARFITADVTQPDDLRRVLGARTGTPVLYFALPPEVTIATCDALGALDLPEGTVLGLEKPFGTGLQSALSLNRQLARLVPESSVHRVDHFLGKSTVLNLLGLRFANRIFEPVWNADSIAKVEILFDEQLALEGRAGYYDRAGALVDMIQSHLLIVLALITMEPPSSLDADDLRGAMAQVLRATTLAGDGTTAARRARYTEGTVAGKPVPSYEDEEGVDPALETETLAEVEVSVENWRWAGVPFLLRSGKALGDIRKEIIIHFKDVPHLPTGFTGNVGTTALRISLTPEDIRLDLNINGERDPFELERVVLSARFGQGELPPYGEILSGMLTADPTLSVRSDVVEECWRIVEPVLDAWRDGRVPLDTYPAGSAGPASWPGTRGEDEASTD